jgi:hypothetical protein
MELIVLLHPYIVVIRWLALAMPSTFNDISDAEWPRAKPNLD